MNKIEKNNVILGLATQEPRQGACDAAPKAISAESRNCHPRACNAKTEELSRIKKGKALSLRGGLMSDEAIFHAETNSVQRLLSRCCKNVEDCRVSAMHFLAMTPITLALAAVLAMGIISESWAATSGCDCGSTENGGNASDCCWKIKDGVLTIYPNPDRSSTGNVTMKDFNLSWSFANKSNGYTSEDKSDAPWARQGVTSVVVENGISNIGSQAFVGDTKITRVSGMENVTSIGIQAFRNATSLQSVDMPNVTSFGEEAFFYASSLQSVDMPNVTSIGEFAFSYASSLTNIIIPDDVNVNNWGAGAFYNTFTNNENSIITCLGDVDTCKTELSKEFGSSIADKVQPASDTQCNSSVNYYYSSSGCVKLPTTQETCTTAGFSWVNDKCAKTAPAANPITPAEGDSQGSGQPTAASCAADGKVLQGNACVSSCGASFKLNDGECDRIRYTPAEAAQYLKDTDNEIIMTFKVNR